MTDCIVPEFRITLHPFRKSRKIRMEHIYPISCGSILALGRNGRVYHSGLTHRRYYDSLTWVSDQVIRGLTALGVGPTQDQIDRRDKAVEEKEFKSLLCSIESDLTRLDKLPSCDDSHIRLANIYRRAKSLATRGVPK